MIAVLEAPSELVRGEIFNVLHSNYQIRELAMLVAGSVQLLGSRSRCARHPRRDSPAITSARTRSSRAGSASSPRARWSRRLASWHVDRRGGQDDAVRPAVLQHPLARAAQRADASDRPVPGCPVSTERPDHRRRRAARLGPRGAASHRCGGRRAVPRRPGHHRRRGRSRRVRRRAADGRLQLRGVPQRRGLRARGRSRVRGQRACGEAARRALRRPRRAIRPPQHELRVRRRGRPTVRRTIVRALAASTRFRSSPASMPPWHTRPARSWSAPQVSTACTAACPRAETS